MRYLKIFTILLLAGTLMAGCCTCRNAKKTKTVPLVGTQWQLVQLDGQSVAVKNDSYTLTFTDDEKVNGKGNCNRYMGTYKLRDGKLVLSRMASTLMFCPDQATEDKYLELLGGCDAFSIDGNLLMLLTGGEVKMTFKPFVKDKE